MPAPRFPLTALLAAVAAASGCAASPLQGLGARVEVAPVLADAAARAVQAVVPTYTAANIDHVALKLYAVDALDAETLAQTGDVPGAYLAGARIGFNMLKYTTHYRVRATAYATSDTSAPISVDARSTIDFTTGQDDAPTIANLPVALADLPYSGQTPFTAVTVTPGGLTAAGSAATTSARIVSSLVGGGAANSGPVSGVGLSGPSAVASDALGNIYFCEETAHRVSMLCRVSGTYFGTAMTAGSVYPLMGTGSAGPATTGVTAAGATVNGPGGLAVDAAGNVIVSDTGNNCLRLICSRAGTFFGGARVPGNVYTIASTLLAPRGVTIDRSGVAVFAEQGGHCVRWTNGSSVTLVAGNSTEGMTGEDSSAANATLSQPAAVAVDAANNVYIADRGNNRVRMVCRTTGVYYGRAMSASFIYTIAGSGPSMAPSSGSFSGDGQDALLGSLFSPAGIAVDAAGSVYVAEALSHRVRRLDPVTGRLSTFAGSGTTGGFAGDGGAPALARFDTPLGLAVSPDGGLFVADSANGRIRQVRFAL